MWLPYVSDIPLNRVGGATSEQRCRQSFNADAALQQQPTQFLNNNFVDAAIELHVRSL